MTRLEPAQDSRLNAPHTPPTAEPATDRDLAAILVLLEQAGLPRDDLTTGAERVRFWVVRDGQEDLLGAIGLEPFGDAGLLRSLVVAPATQGAGLGRLLVGTLEAAAIADGMNQLVLLTLTADQFFARLGYGVIDRATAPVAMRDAAEFRSLCPAAAICMSKTIG